ncbi:Imm32 family immunity protein [Microbulbifer thermotolerans]|uniref:Uncharacterized protein n=1 Tax=Microbulbifer thermotolerans TaxID=252514 RepID=A0AB35HY83_MICTH|nr:hypothetical protein [Microbulbifer thermotolerans]MCX2802498.1 hypothetical protein [Microbulbifer thermotolerans]MCX2833084.1 hypothetical protein [Microbulbifer thermotolerans]WKT60716.1 hypothetical protein Q2E61_00525 [Microbulbifer thermotolerans]
MKAYLASTFSDEEGPMAEEGKTVYIHASKERLLELAKYFAAVAEHIETNGTCHMHFRDYSEHWNKEEYIDVAVDIDENT